MFPLFCSGDLFIIYIIINFIKLSNYQIHKAKEKPRSETLAYFDLDCGFISNTRDDREQDIPQCCSRL